MDETITSFADRVVDVFEMVNQENGGSKTIVNNTVVYHIPSEKPASVYKLFSLDEENQGLKMKLKRSCIQSAFG